MKKKIPYINQVIKLGRKTEKLTQLEFSKEINKGVATIQRYEQGNIIDENTLKIICEYLMINFYQLLEEQEEENNENGTFFYKDIIDKYKENKELKNKEIKELEKIEDIKEIIEFFQQNYDFFIQLEKDTLKDIENIKLQKNIFSHNIFFNIIDNTVKIYYKFIFEDSEENNENEKKIFLGTYELYELIELLKSTREFFNMKLLLLNRKKKLNN